MVTTQPSVEAKHQTGAYKRNFSTDVVNYEKLTNFANSLCKLILPNSCTTMSKFTQHKHIIFNMFKGPVA